MTATHSAKPRGASRSVSFNCARFHARNEFQNIFVAGHPYTDTPPGFARHV